MMIGGERSVDANVAVGVMVKKKTIVKRLR